MNIAYFGSPTMSAQLLEKIIKLENCTTRIVITQKDKPTGKKLQIEACLVKKMAEKKEVFANVNGHLININFIGGNS